MQNNNTRLHTYLASIILFFALLPTTVFALTPIARYDVVPNQRIEYGTTFKFGVVAFSKADISDVTFTVSGSGYSGGQKTTSAMSYNDRTGVYEYWVPVASNEFTSSGPFTVTAVVTGGDGDSRNLGALTLNVDATNSLAQPKAWVQSTGSDSTGKVDDLSKPFSTIAGAVRAIQAENGGYADGGIIYLGAGTYSAGYHAGPTTSNEWLTITRNPEVADTDVIVASTGSALDTHLLKLSGVTIKNSGGFAVPQSTADYLWLDNCRIIGQGRDKRDSNPVQGRGIGRSYWTGNYVHDLSLAIGGAILSRGNNISKISDDAHQNSLCVINDRIDDIDPAPQYPDYAPHADVYQMHVTNVPSPENIIIYGIYATNFHYQGIFARPSSEGSPVKSASNVAIVNNFLESRLPNRLPGGGVSSLMGIWNHLLLWNNTFAGKEMVIYHDTTTKAFSFKNVSIVGNYFHAFRDSETNGAAFDKGNSNNNEAISNHYYLSYDDGYGSDNRTHSPDTEIPASASAGTLELDLSDSVNYVNFGYPQPTSVLLNRINDVKVNSDAMNVGRGLVADIGALEKSPSVNKSPPSPPTLNSVW